MLASRSPFLHINYMFLEANSDFLRQPDRQQAIHRLRLCLEQQGESLWCQGG